MELTRKHLKILQKQLHSSADHQLHPISSLSILRVETLFMNDEQLVLDESGPELPTSQQTSGAQEAVDSSSTVSAERHINSSMDILDGEDQSQLRNFETTETVGSIDPSLLRKVEVHVRKGDGGMFNIFDPDNSSLLLVKDQKKPANRLQKRKSSTDDNHTILKDLTFLDCQENVVSVKRPATSTKSKIPVPQSFKVPKFNHKNKNVKTSFSFDLRFPKI